MISSVAAGAFEKKKARVEIIPLIDVVFFLLATFVLFTLSLDRIQALPVPLPAVPPGPFVPPEILFLQTTDTGAVYWKMGAASTPELISRAELAGRLGHYLSTTSNPRVMVRGDNRAKFGESVAIFDEVRRSGISQVSIETMPSKTGQ